MCRMGGWMARRRKEGKKEGRASEEACGCYCFNFRTYSMPFTTFMVGKAQVLE